MAARLSPDGPILYLSGGFRLAGHFVPVRRVTIVLINVGSPGRIGHVRPVVLIEDRSILQLFLVKMQDSVVFPQIKKDRVSDPAGSSVDYEVFDFSEVLILCVDDFTADHRLLGWNYICVSDCSRFCDGFHVYTSLLKGSWLTRLLPPPHGKRDGNGYLFTSRHIRVLFTSLEKRNRQETLADLPPTASTSRTSAH